MVDPAPPSPALRNFERLLAAGKDSALLRFGLGNEFLKCGDVEAAVTHLRRAVALDPGYSAAWKLLGKALSAAQRDDEALAAWHEGIAAAQRKGDKQAMREMQVFARRLAKQRSQA
ncbi:MAG TPA: tetratricopeptide repeat protein [Casimicrobiaceae bacterium]|jgi:predicted Zn-dependent protease|nr:tetratricopeptide repeat protein [Casimicrobiaceae bacterium]